MSVSLRFINITTADGQERRFAMGLWWQLRHAGPAPKKTLRLNARKIADEFRDEEYNVVLLREQQFGLGRTKEAELPEKVHSLADALRMRREQDAFVAVFNLEPELWWVVAISKGIIAAEGDTWHESREAAEKAAHSHQQMISVEFRVFETPEESLEFLLPLLAPERILEELYPNPDRQRQMLVRLGKVAALIAAGAAAWFAWNWYQGREASRLLESRMETRARYEAELRANPERVFKMHWNQAPQVADAGGQCVEAITSQPLADLGWTLDELICAPGSGVTVYRRHNAGASFTELPERVKLITSQRTSEHVPLLKLPVRAAVPHEDL
ncbi:MAG: type 4b pilus protein PilO2, partial [Desulfovibrionaceae bacterium]|nr:type 4b pilus protein PilO2 [Desulfovibrionaceae bacterium]